MSTPKTPATAAISKQPEPLSDAALDHVTGGGGTITYTGLEAPNRASGWGFQILPYIEQDNLYR